MKKIIKFFIIIISIIIILYLINFFRNYLIINELLVKAKNFKISNNYELKQTSLSTSVDNISWEVLSEYYCKDNIYLYKNTTTLTKNLNKETTTYGVWHNKNSNEHIEFIYDNNSLMKDEVIDKEKLELPPLSSLVFNNFSDLNYLKSIVLKENDVYKIQIFHKNYKSILYINSNTGIIESLNYIYNDSSYTLINSYEENIITDEMIKKPNF